MGVHDKDQKHPKFGHLPLSTSGPQECALTGHALLRTPYLNKGTAFSPKEREDFKLHGLLPQDCNTLEEQCGRAYQQFSSRKDDIAKNTFMTSMKEQNEVLYYRLIQDHIQEMFPIIYTPTEGEAIANYSRLFRRPEGCFLNIDDVDRVDTDLGRFGGTEDIDLMVVSDGEQILGIGDQGVGGILISVAKLVIYTLCAGIHPNRVLPVVLDCGTNNQELLSDDLYLGLKKPRATGVLYDRFVDTFVRSARKHYPKAYLHFEDFGLTNARRILDKYTGEIACFNDDVQGTGAVTLAAIYAALYVTRTPMSDLRIVAFGAGSAGTGIADQIRDAIAVEGNVSKEEAGKHIWAVDKPGLLLRSKKDMLTPAQIPYARENSDWPEDAGDDLLTVIKRVKPHVLIGTSTKPGAFTEEIVKEMAQHVERPIIFPLSNPTRLHEARPQDLMDWTEGKALVATGSPFPPVDVNGKKIEISECNNSVCFPGIGLGAVLSRTRLLPPSMLVAAVKAFAREAPILRDPNAGLLPGVTQVRDVSVKIAKAIIKQAMKENLQQEKGIPTDEEELEDWIREQLWDARYRALRKIDKRDAGPMELGVAGTARSP